MNEPMRVLQIIGIVCGGGVESVVMNYYRHIDRSKVQFDFVIDGYGTSILDEEIARLGGKVYKVEPYKSNVFKYMEQIYKIVKMGHYTIVHSHMNTLAIFGLFAAWLAGAKVRIAHNHATSDISEGKRYWMKMLLRPLNRFFANKYCACSQVAGKWMFGKLDNVKIIKNAFDIDAWSYNECVRNRWRSKLNLNDKFVLGHVGRFEQAKNHMFLLDVFAELKRSSNNSVLMLVGDGSLRKQIENRVKCLGIEKDVLILGLRADANELMQAMDVLIIPSFFEGLSMVAIEGQAASLPIIASMGVPQETDVTNGIVFLPLAEGQKKWSEKILFLRNTNVHTSHKRELIVAGYDISLAANELEGWYAKFK